MRRLELPADVFPKPLFSVSPHLRADLEHRFGASHGEETDLSVVLAPSSYWAFELDDQTRILFEFFENPSTHEGCLNVYASSADEPPVHPHASLDPLRLALALGLPLANLFVPTRDP